MDKTLRRLWGVILRKAHPRIEFKRYPFSTLGEADDRRYLRPRSEHVWRRVGPN
jgi:hypothetical protein